MYIGQCPYNSIYTHLKNISYHMDTYGLISMAIFSEDIPWNLGLKNRPKIYGRYLQFRILEWPLKSVQPQVEWVHIDQVLRPRPPPPVTSSRCGNTPDQFLMLGDGTLRKAWVYSTCSLIWSIYEYLNTAWWWLEPWNLDWMTFHSYWEESSQLLLTHIFQRVETTNQNMYNKDRMCI